MPTPVWMGCAERNFRPGRPLHLSIEAVVIHIIDGPLAVADSLFLNPSLEKPRSAHYAVGRDGTIHRYVHEEDTAFHAGLIVNPTWPGMKRAANGKFINPNFYTVGIEHEGGPHDDWTDAMYDASAWLLRELSGRHPGLAALTRANVVLHREIRATKTCPGFKLDVATLIAKAGGQP